eukprot:CAMPEP_0174832738 /NCGR_PEP_ID=MMETSP1114-20130205/3829_1 /TAXON_ID=312471 /ORGANISM="Neobodo designis, Strain CCAP 1951/1" /LENGTH=404 /DNA_ID=CAMNT_0016066603 /DNA_START=65 /DNA_END=1279 /DNA_ORIENTATION=-
MSATQSNAKPAKVKVTIRPATEADAATVAEFEQQLSITTEGNRLDQAAVERGVRVPLERPNLARIFVACVYRRAGENNDSFVSAPDDEDDSSDDKNGAKKVEEIIGFMTAGVQWSEWEGGFVHYVFSTFIAEPYRGRGVFGQLFRFVKKYVLADRLSVGMRLYVERENDRAQETYKRLGMEIEDFVMFKWMKPSDELPSNVGTSASDDASANQQTQEVPGAPLPPKSPIVARPSKVQGNPWTIRPAKAGDIPTLVEMQKTYAADSARKTLAEDALRRGIAMAWAEPGLARIYVAELDGAVIGMVVVSNEWSEWRGGIVYWLTSLYVEAAHRRKGVLSSLYAFAKSQVQREPNAVGIRMQVRKHNAAGLAVAKSLGMTEEPYYLMRWVDPAGAVVSRESGIRSQL